MKPLDCYEFYLWSTGQLKVAPNRVPNPQEYFYENLTRED